jgi:hypothetical protein
MKIHRKLSIRAATRGEMAALRVLSFAGQQFAATWSGEARLAATRGVPGPARRPGEGRHVMSSKLSMEEVLSNLEQRAVVLRDQEAFHAQQEAHHREQRELHAAELAKVLQCLESFRTIVPAAVDLARPAAARPAPAATPEEEKLPPPGRLMVGRLLRRVIASASLAEPFGATAVAAEANRRFADRLPGPVGPRTASDILRRMLADGDIQLARKGKPSHEALYTRRSR